MSVNLYRTAKGGLAHWVLAIWLIVAGFCCETVSRASDVAEVVGRVNVDSYKDYLQNDLYTHNGDDREYGAGHDLARQNIQDRLEGFGLATSLDPGAYNNVEYSNVMGVLPGVIRPDEVYVLGAHYDTVRSPGAYDNASGVAAVLEAARVLSQYRFEATLVFIAFDREEKGYIGSGAYAEEHRQDVIRGMISLDCIAYHPYQPGTPDYSKVGVSYSYRRTDIVDDLAAALGSYVGLTSIVSQHTWSDNEHFDSVGFDSALLISYAGCSPFYHTPSDSVDKLGDSDYEYGTQITRGVVGYLASRAGLAPVRLSPDFNADRHVDIEDLTLLIEHWGQNDPSFDIAPPLVGDGIVDVQDLEGLLHYWDREIPEPGMVAHWNLDETEGMIACDAVGANDANAVGNPVWQPAGGEVGGALRLDGIDDYVGTPFIVDPSQHPFSVFAWVKGGGPGQVILSQAGGANWLIANAPAGALATELKSIGRQSSVLTSQTVVTDGDWHLLGLTWDGTHRILYVDDIEVAKDTQANLPSASGGLRIGTGSTLAPGTFWSGLIDDVRIYDRAVKP